MSYRVDSFSCCCVQQFLQQEICALSLLAYPDQPKQYAMLWMRFEQTVIDQLIAKRNPSEVFLIEPLLRHLVNKVQFTLSRIKENPAYVLTVDECLKINVGEQIDASDICGRVTKLIIFPKIQAKLKLPSESFRCDDEEDIVVDNPSTRAIIKIGKTTPYWRDGVQFATPVIVASALNRDETRYVYNVRWIRKDKYTGMLMRSMGVYRKI
ncbi:hypothetical protein EG68_05563 [Paragonimus skrjabini miyazakii]|uniref:Uncharacterized protein n=1 Tax=Paragonimus skrjabini miyazakii TaxID=59628 RepID=A0A8S9Z302_9TREM|nr:hypothetical protein EG68_05563 [Paragonimus skrjabini miyazakii]